MGTLKYFELWIWIVLFITPRNYNFEFSEQAQKRLKIRNSEATISDKKHSTHLKTPYSRNSFKHRFLCKYVPPLMRSAQTLETFPSSLRLFWQTSTGTKGKSTSSKLKQQLYSPDFNTFLILILTNTSSTTWIPPCKQWNKQEQFFKVSQNAHVKYFLQNYQGRY